MKNAIVLATVIGLGAVAAGCNPEPKSVTAVPLSALPPAAKGMLVPEAQVTGVSKAYYGEDRVDYVIDYTIDGKSKQAIYADYHESRPSGVFDRFHSNAR